MMHRVAPLFIVAFVILAACGGNDETATGSAVPGSESAPVVAVAPATVTAPTTVPAGLGSQAEEDLSTAPAGQTGEPEEDLSRVPFPAPRDNERLVLGSPPSIFDFYDDIAPVEDFVVYEGEQGQISMTEAFVKEGLTYGYVTWTNDGVTQSASSPASNELAKCAADVLAESMDRFDAELIARGIIESNDGGATGELIDLYIECGGTNELLNSFRDSIRLDRTALLDVACVEATVTTEEHLRIVSNSGEGYSDDFLDLVGPCFNWSLIPFALADSSAMCLEARKADGLRSIVGSDAAGFRSILESCLTPEELAQIPG